MTSVFYIVVVARTRRHTTSVELKGVTQATGINRRAKKVLQTRLARKLGIQQTIQFKDGPVRMSEIFRGFYGRVTNPSWS